MNTKVNFKDYVKGTVKISNTKVIKIQKEKPQKKDIKKENKDFAEGLKIYSTFLNLMSTFAILKYSN